MRNKEKTKLQASEDSVLYEIALAWHNFKKKFGTFAETIDECFVELGFDTSLDEKTHFSFFPDEVVYFSDIQITEKGLFAINVPWGKDKNDKVILYKDTELISYKIDKNPSTYTLQSYLQKTFHECFEGIESKLNIPIFEKKYLQENKDLIPILNDIDNFLEDLELMRKRKEMYSKLPDYGIF